jgi:hypothetical protein
MNDSPVTRPKRGERPRLPKILILLLVAASAGAQSNHPGPAAARSESYRQPILRANIRLPRPRSMEYMKLGVSVRNPNIQCPDLGSSCQKVLSVNRSGAVVEIRRPGIPAGPEAETERTGDIAECLAANDYIQSDSPSIRSAAIDAVGVEGDPFRGALKLQTWVSENMRVGRGIALASALEVLGRRHGTSLGAAALLAALARSLEIPARVVLGYVYTSGGFLGHAWTEIRAGGEWIPLDPSLPGDGIADAARVALCSSSLKNGLGHALGRGSSGVFGHVGLKSLGYAEKGKSPVVVPDRAIPYRVSEGVYENSWLGLTWRRPSDWRFAKFNPMWPDTAIVSLTSPEGARVEIRMKEIKPWWTSQSAADEIFTDLRIVEGSVPVERHGFPGFLAVSPSRAGLVLIDGLTAWVIVADGPHPERLVEAATKDLRIGR